MMTILRVHTLRFFCGVQGNFLALLFSTIIKTIIASFQNKFEIENNFKITEDIFT